MKIWHQSFTVLDHLDAYKEALQVHFKRVARPDTQIDMHGMHPSTYRTNYPGNDIRHVGLHNLHALQFIANAVQAQREGYDVFALSSLPDPGLREIRALVDIPVVGYGESAMFTACQLGRKFGVLVFIDDLNELIAQNAHGHGLAERFAGAEPVGFTFNDVLKAYGEGGAGELLERFRESARRLIARGADVIIPGEAPMNILLARSGLNEVDGVPVLDSLAVWVKQAEMMHDLRTLCGTKPSRKGYYHKLPDAQRVQEVLAFYGLDTLRDRK
jgi:Asp/Glu/hydantoin racemase